MVPSRTIRGGIALGVVTLGPIEERPNARMTKDRPVASVIIPAYRSWGVLRLCLDALQAQTCPSEAFEILIANNDPSGRMPADYPLPANARVIDAPRPGSYAARNRAMAEARGDWMLFTDADCVPEPDWVERVLDAARRSDLTCRIAGGIEVVPSGAAWTAAERYDSLVWLRQADYVRSGWGTTANLTVHRSLFDRVGPFSEVTYSGGDKEWNGRAAAAGSGIVYAPEALIKHPARASFDELAQKKRRIVGGRHRLKPRGRFRRFVPPLGYILPSWSRSRRFLTDTAVPFRIRLEMLLIDYRLNLVTFSELVRLRFQSHEPQRI